MTTNEIVARLVAYQAANTDAESIKKCFVVRVHEFERIIDDLLQKKMDDPIQHEVILGRRGSGKSTLLRRIQIEVQENEDLNKQYLAISPAGEEQASIYRMFDLWEMVLNELQNLLKIKIELEDFRQFDTPQAYSRYLYGTIHEILKKEQKKIVLLVDNIDRILENFGDDGHLLRELLLNYDDIKIVGGSTRMNEYFWRYDQPFYEFFRVHRLEKLSSQEVRNLLLLWSDLLELPKLAEFVHKNSGKIEAIRILTDGLPRTMQFFVKILLQNTQAEGYEYLKKVMDEVTPLYQERLNPLPAAHRKLVQEMAFVWEACSAKELADICRMESKLVSAHLKQLTQIGVVETLQTDKRNHLYRLAERFFNMWLMVTQGNPTQKRRAKWLSIFLESFYDEQELQTLANEHLDKLRTGKLSYDKALPLSKAFCQIRFISTTERDEIIELTQKMGSIKDCLIELPEKYEELIKAIDELMEQKKWEKALKKVEEIENEGDGIKFFLQAYIYDELNDNNNAEKYNLLAIDKKHINAPYNLAIFYYANNQNKEKSLELIQTYNKTQNKSWNSEMLETIIALWNGITDNLPEKVNYLIDLSKDGDLNLLFQLLMIHHQTALVISFFEDAIHGEALRNRYTPLHYAALAINTKKDNLRIPPELQETVQELIDYIKTVQLFYYPV